MPFSIRVEGGGGINSSLCLIPFFVLLVYIQVYAGKVQEVKRVPFMISIDY